MYNEKQSQSRSHSPQARSPRVHKGNKKGEQELVHWDPSMEPCPFEEDRKKSEVAAEENKKALTAIRSRLRHAYGVGGQYDTIERVEGRVGPYRPSASLAAMIQQENAAGGGGGIGGGGGRSSGGGAGGGDNDGAASLMMFFDEQDDEMWKKVKYAPNSATALLLSRQFESLSRKDIQLAEKEELNHIMLAFMHGTRFLQQRENNRNLRRAMIEIEDAKRESEAAVSLATNHLTDLENGCRRRTEQAAEECRVLIDKELSRAFDVLQFGQQGSQRHWMEQQESRARHNTILDHDRVLSRIYAMQLTEYQGIILERIAREKMEQQQQQPQQYQPQQQYPGQGQEPPQQVSHHDQQHQTAGSNSAGSGGPTEPAMAKQPQHSEHHQGYRAQRQAPGGGGGQGFVDYGEGTNVGDLRGEYEMSGADDDDEQNLYPQPHPQPQHLPTGQEEEEAQEHRHPSDRYPTTAGTVGDDATAYQSETTNTTGGSSSSRGGGAPMGTKGSDGTTGTAPAASSGDGHGFSSVPPTAPSAGEPHQLATPSGTIATESINREETDAPCAAPGGYVENTTQSATGTQADTGVSPSATATTHHQVPPLSLAGAGATGGDQAATTPDHQGEETADLDAAGEQHWSSQPFHSATTTGAASPHQQQQVSSNTPGRAAAGDAPLSTMMDIPPPQASQRPTGYADSVSSGAGIRPSSASFREYWGWMAKSTGVLVTWQQRFFVFTKSGKMKCSTGPEGPWQLLFEAPQILRVELDSYHDVSSSGSRPPADQYHQYGFYVDVATANATRPERMRFCSFAKQDLNIWLQVLRQAVEVVYQLEETHAISPSPLRQRVDPGLLERSGGPGARGSPVSYRRRTQLEDESYALEVARKGQQMQRSQSPVKPPLRRIGSTPGHDS